MIQLLVTRGCERTVNVGFETAVADEATDAADEEASDAASLTSSTASARTTAAARAAVAIWVKRMVRGELQGAVWREGNSSMSRILKPRAGGC